MVSKLIEILEEDIDFNGQLRDRVRITITDTSGERRFISEKVRPKKNGGHDFYADRTIRMLVKHRNFE